MTRQKLLTVPKTPRKIYVKGINESIPLQYDFTDVLDGIFKLDKRGHIVSGAVKDLPLTLKNPYSYTNLRFFEESYRQDGTTRTAVDRYVDFVFGKRFKCVVNLADEYEDYVLEDVRQKALENLLSQQEYKRVKVRIAKIHRKVKFKAKIKEAGRSMKVFGRSALMFNPDSFSFLKKLNSRLMGEVELQDAYNWEMKGVRYVISQKGKIETDNLIPKEQLIYFVNQDVDITPMTMFYGLSAIEPVSQIAEINRILNQLSLKETAFSLWAKGGYLQFDDAENDQEVQNAMNAYRFGRLNAGRLKITPHIFDITGSIADLDNLRKSNSREIAAQMKMPAFLVSGEEGIPNYATAKEVILAFKESVLDFERNHIIETLEDQWFDMLLVKFGIHDEEVEENLARPLDEMDDMIDDLEKMKNIRGKITGQFEEIIIEDLKSKVESVKEFRDVLPIEILLELLGWKQFIPYVRKMEEERQARAREFRSVLTKKGFEVSDGANDEDNGQYQYGDGNGEQKNRRFQVKGRGNQDSNEDSNQKNKEKIRG